MPRAWPGTGYVVAVGIGLVLGFLSAWFDSLPIDTPLIVLVAMANAVGPWLIGAFVAGSRLPDHRRGALGGLRWRSESSRTTSASASSMATDCPNRLC